MGEVHIIGQIIGATDFPQKSLFCKWTLQTGSGWRLISGNIEGQTQVDEPVYGKKCFWCYPIDIHFVTKSIQGWPRLQLQIFHFDSCGRVQLFGYGHLNIPTTSGEHQLTCYVWRPVGSLTQRIVQYFLGGAPQLTQPDYISNAGDRYKLNTESMGSVSLQLGIILRHFDNFGVEYK